MTRRRISGRVRRRVGATAVAAAAMAALTGSQAPGLAARTTAADMDVETPGDAYYLSELPPLRVHNPVPFPPTAPSAPGPDSPGGSAFLADRGTLPATVLAAYLRAESALARTTPGCALSRHLLAAIGQVESGQARGGRVNADGTTNAPIIGPQLNGRGFALIRDTDGGAYDGDPAYDHAVGPMQFIPSTWARWGADGNGDGRADPHNVHDAALAAGRYLCAGGRNLSLQGDLDRAILSYNRSRAYLRTVLAWYGYYRDGYRVIPDAGGSGSVAPSGTRTGTGPASGAGKGPGPRSGGASPASPSSSPSPSPSTGPKPSPSPTPKPSPSPSSTTGPKPLPSLVTGPGNGSGTGVELPGDGALPGAGALPGNG